MPYLPIDNIGALGIIKDVAPYQLPNGAWSDGNNVSFFDGAVNKMKGHAQVFGTILDQPYYMIPVRVQDSYFWCYASLSDLYMTDGTNHANVSKSAAAYSATATRRWMGAHLGGSILIMNNGIDVPQQWAGTTYTDQFSDLSNWPAAMQARVLVAFKQFLIAANVDNGAGRNNTMVRWSHPADPGGVPVSWDYTDVSLDAGVVELSETSDAIVDAVSLRDTLYLYRDNSVYAMQYVGGLSVFAFRRAFSEFGVIAHNCVNEIKGRHVVFGNDDIVIHDGNFAESLIERRWRRYLFNVIGTPERSFVVSNLRTGEVWFCYAESGYEHPNMALVWNFNGNTISHRALPVTTPHIARGVLDTGESQTFDDDAGEFDDATGTFDDVAANLSLNHLLIAHLDDEKLYKDGDGETFDGSPFTSFVERTCIQLGSDNTTTKTIYEVWPRISGTIGTVVDVYVGSQNHVDEAVSWSGPFPFTIGTTVKVDCHVTGRLPAIRFESDDPHEWRILGYTLKYEIGGVV